MQRPLNIDWNETSTEGPAFVLLRRRLSEEVESAYESLLISFLAGSILILYIKRI